MGKSKAEVAAARVNERVPGVRVTPHHGRIEDFPADWYRQFQIIVLGLDSLEARRYMNSVACGFVGAPSSAAAAAAAPLAKSRGGCCVAHSLCCALCCAALPRLLR